MTHHAQGNGQGAGPDGRGGRQARGEKRPRTLRRRLFLTASGVLGGGVLLGGAYAVNFASVYGDRKMTNLGTLSFANKVRIPPLLEGTSDGSGGRRFTLTAQEGASELIPGKQTPTWGVNGAFLGPTLRARRGDRVSVHFTNKLPETTTMHWHGMHLPAVNDGGPHQSVVPGAVWRPEWEIVQPASTLWYHPHPHGQTADHVSRGLAGMFILDDDASDGAGLPGRYGVDDIPLILQDREFNDDGSIELRNVSTLESFAGVGNIGVLGDTILVNGTYDPHLRVTTTLVRLRLMNGSNARVFNLGFTDNREFTLVALENGLVAKPVPLRRIQLAPAERAEVVVAVEPGERTVLRSFPPDIGVGFPTKRLDGGEDTFDMIELRADKRLTESPPVPDRLRGAPAPIELPDSPRVRRFRLSGTNINGKKMDMERIDEVCPAGRVEVWEVEGNADGVHSFHIHGLSFNVLQYAGNKPAAHLVGAKDTVYVPPGDMVRLAVALPDYTDEKKPYMFHCHQLRHEDQGMMGQFTVVKPGSEGDAPRQIIAYARH
ncbi:multicopper oxidase family protein [Streptomyces sp. MUM 178J]|uniref:multicopper oxidase family protein n=1 Tax=Streptomyces sp. MUM 178J TaxID=2791991 RepID=UPI001F04F334|nr:multicopper oxidase domain-containing protein [Streptomyces sp. MUM 178J]WRQ80132.1 multicopper oxidase domain-containing protein [Streptomyces sp. MUM 178J]